jgi:hypothetical protein
MNRTKEYTEMTTRELAEATKEFDAESVNPPGKPLTRAQRARFEAARKGGRPVVGEGVQVVSLSVEKGLLRRTDAAARKHRVSRAQFVAQALEFRLNGRHERRLSA